MIQHSFWTLVALIGAFCVPALGIGVMIAMADCHHQQTKPPSLKED